MGMPTTKIVKSAQRVTELLELFDEDRDEVTVMEIVRELNYPQSSASELLRSLAALGYLSYDRFRRTYKPTARVALIGRWVNPPLFRDKALLFAMNTLMQETGDTVVLATIDSFSVRYIHAVKPRHSAPDVRIGSTMSPFRSALGRAIASHWSEKLIQDTVRRLNAEEPDGIHHLRPREVIADLQNVAAVGHAVMAEEFNNSHGVVAISLPDEPNIAIGLTFPMYQARQASERAGILLRAFADAGDLRQPEKPVRLISSNDPQRITPFGSAPTTPPTWRSAPHEGHRA